MDPRENRPKAVLISGKHPVVMLPTIAVRSDDEQALTVHIPWAQVLITGTTLELGLSAKLSKEPALRQAACGETRTFPTAVEQACETPGIVIDAETSVAEKMVATKATCLNMIIKVLILSVGGVCVRKAEKAATSSSW